MKTYILDFINRYNRFSENLDVRVVLCNKSWSIFNDSGDKEIYIFQEDGSLITSVNGIVLNTTWKYISANKSLIINAKDKSYMFHPAFMDGIVFALQLDGTNECFFMIDEGNERDFIPKSLSDLRKYFVEQEKNVIENSSQNQTIYGKEESSHSIKTQIECVQIPELSAEEKERLKRLENSFFVRNYEKVLICLMLFGLITPILVGSLLGFLACIWSIGIILILWVVFVIYSNIINKEVPLGYKVVNDEAQTRKE